MDLFMAEGHVVFVVHGAQGTRTRTKRKEDVGLTLQAKAEPSLE